MRTRRKIFAVNRPRADGFTLVELCLGMAITTLVAAALGSFALAMGNCWRRANGAQASAMIANQLSVRLQSRLQDAKRIGYWRGGAGQFPAGMIFWRGDLNDDLVMNYGELSVLAFDADNKQLVTYTPTVVDEDMGDEWIAEDFNDAGAIERLKLGISATPIVQHVSAATLTIDQATSSTMNPTVTWNIKFTQSDGTLEEETIASTLRAPATPAE